jgi:hypothetical protein
MSRFGAGRRCTRAFCCALTRACLPDARLRAFAAMLKNPGGA